ncbi:hypothetical protein MMPV_002499 [Pyropia vietnamensis]
MLLRTLRLPRRPPRSPAGASALPPTLCRALSEVPPGRPLPRSAGHCLHLLRTFDHENYLINLLHPSPPSRAATDPPAPTPLPLPTIRRAHTALRALNITLLHVRGLTTNEDTARARFAFWASGVAAALAGSPQPATAAPVLAELAAVTAVLPPKAVAAWAVLLPRLVAARAAELVYPTAVTVAEVAAASRDTHGALAAAHAVLLGGGVPASTIEGGTTATAAAAAPAGHSARVGAQDSLSPALRRPTSAAVTVPAPTAVVPPPTNAADVAEAVGTAVGLAVLLRGVPAAAAARLSYIPTGVAAAAGVTSRGVLLSPPAAAATATDAAAAVAAYRVVGEAAAAALADARRAGKGGALRRRVQGVYPARLGLALLRRRLFGGF